MCVLTAILLGIVQGLTEFLPVSSSGHLVLLQKILGIEEPALLFDIMVHCGTLAGVVVVLRRDIWAILRRLFQPLTAYLIIATVPTVIAALVFRRPLEKAFETGQYLGISFLITAALLAAAELLPRRFAGGRTLSQMNWLDSLVIGIMQAIAIVPGISRSGATLSGALSCGLNRDFAARFSFLLSIPAIAGAAVFQLKDAAKGGETALEAAYNGIGAAAMFAGTLSAAVVGFFAVSLMLKIVREKSLWGFAAYTGILGLLIIIDQYVTRLVF